MTSYQVMKNFKLFIKKVVEETRLTTKNNKGRVPQVVLGYLSPLEDFQEEKEDFPYILIRYMQGENNNDESIMNLKLIFGVYSQDGDGWIDILHLIEIIRTELLKKRVFDFYTLENPIKVSIPEEQPYPYFYGFMELKFNIPQVQVEGVTGWVQ